MGKTRMGKREHHSIGIRAYLYIDFLPSHIFRPDLKIQFRSEKTL
jgi:hypothetical protein